MYNFFVSNEQFNNDLVKIIGQDAKHISQVLRMKKKEKIFICNKDSNDKYIVEIEEIKKDEVLCKMIKKEESAESNIKVTLFQGLPKSDKMEYIIQKSVELGVYDIVPLEMKNCIVKIKDADKKISRWQAISEAAAKQSKRNVIPKINKIESIKTIKDRLDEYDLVIVAYENERKSTIKEILKENKNISNVAIIVGPEGGIDESEIDILTDLGVKSVSLGKRILRTETAPIVILSMIMYELEL